MTITISVKGLAELEASLKRVAATLEPELYLDQGAALLLNNIRARFLQNVDPDGEPWKPSKAAIKRGGMTLFDTGRLFRSLQLYADEPNSRAIGTDVPYAHYHNFGVGGQERRTFMGFSDDDSKVVTRLIIKRIKDALA